MADSDYNKLLKRVLDDASTTKVVEDRFKMPKAEIFYEGNTTVIKNFDKISDAVNREANLILKFLLGGLGTAGEMDGVRVVFQGKIPAKHVQDKIKEYIDTYVICSECNRPDTHLVKQGRTTLIRCDACGAFRSVKSRRKKVVLQPPVETLKEGSVYDLTIKDIGRKGDGVAYFDKYIIYISGAVKGSTVKVKIEKISGTVAFGQVVAV
jgi:translation initiation factor 2 subunit 2